MNLEINNLHFSYKNNIEILSGINLAFDSCGLNFILGCNGSGKSTLFKCLLGLEKAQQGTIKIDSTNIETIGRTQLAKSIAYIPQSSYSIFNYSVRQTVLMGRVSSIGIFSSPTKIDNELTDKVLSSLNLEHLANCGVNEISGGEHQLALIARALVQEAKILIMDEPVSNLDYGNQIRVLENLKSLSKDICIIESSHNPEQALLFGDRVSALYKGKIIEDGKPSEIITSSLLKHLYNIEAEVKNFSVIPKIHQNILRQDNV